MMMRTKESNNSVMWCYIRNFTTEYITYKNALLIIKEFQNEYKTNQSENMQKQATTILINCNLAIPGKDDPITRKKIAVISENPDQPFSLKDVNYFVILIRIKK